MENIYLKKFQAENEELIKYYFYEKRKINIYSYGTIAITFLFSSIIFFLWAIDRKYSTLKLFENGDL